MKVTLELPDDWAACLPAREEKLAEIVVAGLRRRHAPNRAEIHHLADVVETLAGLPSPEEVMSLRPSPALAERIAFLLGKKRAEKLTPEEEAEWADLMRVEHLVRMAKARAAMRLKTGGATA